MLVRSIDRIARSVACLILFAALVPHTVPAQTLALASGGPRFLYASTKATHPVEVNPTANVTLRRRVSLNLERPTVGSLLGAISRQTGLEFVYSREALPINREVGLHADSITVAAALTEILMDAGLDVLLSPGRQVVLVERQRTVDEVAVGAIAGRVTDAKTQTGLAGATVVVQGTSHSATTGNDGRYRIAGVLAGAYTVRARYIGYAPGVVSVTVSADQAATADFALEKSAQQLDEVVTTGTVVPTEVKALPTPVSLITATDIEQQRPHTVQELFRQTVPTAVGWDFAAAPSSLTFSTRGASTLDVGGAQMKVFIDGIEAASGSAAGLDPNSIDHIEVVRGPQAAAIYGSGAIGGVIQVFTKRGDPSLTRPHVDAQAAVGMIQTPYAGYTSVARQTYTASVYGGGSDVGYNLGAGYSHTPDYVQPGTAQSNPSVYGGMRFAQGIMTLDIAGRYYVQNTPIGFNPAMEQTGFAPVSKPYYWPAQNQNQTLGLHVNVAPTTWWRNTLTAGIDRNAIDVAQTQPRLTTTDDTLLAVYDFGSTKNSIGYATALQGALGADLSASLTAGFDHYSLTSSGWFAFGALQTTGSIPTDPSNPATAERDITNNTGYFAQAQLGLKEALFLTAGLRAEQNTNFGDSLGTPVSPRAGLSFVQSVSGATLKLRGSWGRAIRPPSPGTKLASAQPGYIQLANPTLGPQRQRGWDAGVDLVFGRRGSLSLTYYKQTAEHLIDLVQAQVVPVVAYQYQNVGRVQNSGVELEAALSAGPVQARAQYGYARARVDQLAPGYTGDLLVGDQVLGTPKHTAGAALAVSALRGTTLSAGATYVGSWTNYDYLAEYRCFGGTGPCQPSTRGYIVAYPGFVKINASIAQQVTSTLSGFVSIDNLTDRAPAEFENFEAVMGRITTIGIRFAY